METPSTPFENHPKIQIHLTRDSVCAGDDGEAPHEKEKEVPPSSDPAAFALSLASGYLPSVDGLGHSWICTLNGIHIAEITTSGAKALIRDTPFSDRNKVHFTYRPAPC